MIRFDAGSATITPQGSDLLEEIAALLLPCPTVQFEVGAHLAEDAEGAFVLSQRRAEAVVAALEVRGIVKDRLVAQGYGAAQPACRPCNRKRPGEERADCLHRTEGDAAGRLPRCQ